MPPKAKITKEMILQTVLEMTREAGFEAVNARSIASRLACSTRPIFTCYENMEELKKEFLDFAYAYYEQYVEGYKRSAEVEPSLILPLSYIAFAQEETPLFKLLFINDMTLDMTAAQDFYKEAGNEEKAKSFAQIIGVEEERAKEIFLDLFLYAHGLAVLTAAKKIALPRADAEKRVRHLLTALIAQDRPAEKNVDGITGREER